MENYFNIRFDQFFIHTPGSLWFNEQHLRLCCINKPEYLCLAPACRDGISLYRRRCQGLGNV
ncbi:hypothetical protein DWG24_07315 [Dickeya zeae]|uniref:Uncharacterized protein n=1 Tax=Dickeya zeae TaxID=204042 RepID=A0AAE7CYS1_9GAMM|nr:hypothetical protein DWG24_07315 [Dickeya zeae]